MIRLLVWGILLVAVHCVENEAKIRMIWNDMDAYPMDGRLNIQEVQLFFSNMSNINGEIVDLQFDYEWGTRYDDTPAVTEYIFRKWDVYPSPPDGLLTEGDLVQMYTAIDSNHPDSVGFIDFFWEFHPYFDSLYKEAPQNRIIGSILG